MNKPRRAQPAVVQALESRQLLSFTPFGTETSVPFPTGGLSTRHDSAVSRDGSYIVASIVSSPTATSLVASRYSATGNAIGGRITLGEVPESPGTNPARFSDVAVATDADGDSVIAYSTFEVANSSTSIYFIQLSQNGVVSAPKFLTSGNAGNPQVSMAEDGSFFVGWTAVNQRDTFVRVAAFNSVGDPIAPRFTAAHQQGSLPSQILNLSLSASEDGSEAVFGFTFFEDTDSTGLPDVYHGRVSTSAVIDPASGLAADHTRSGQVAILEDGSYYLGYEVLPLVNFEPSFEQASTFVQRFDSDGDPVDSPIEVGGSLGDGVHLSDLAAVSDGGFVTAIYTGEGDTASLYTQRNLASGQTDHAQPILVDTTTTGELLIGTSGRIGADQNGTALVSYRKQTATDPARGPVYYRRLTAQPAAIDKSILYVLGTESADTISVRSSGLSYVVTRGNDVRRFGQSLVSQLAVNGFAGDDFISNNTSLTAFMDGGAGNDTVVGGSGGDRITGAGGNDRLYGGDGDDLIYGQDGDDVLFGGNGNDRLNGGTGSDTFRGEAGSDRVEAADGIADLILGQGANDPSQIDIFDVNRSSVP